MRSALKSQTLLAGSEGSSDVKFTSSHLLQTQNSDAIVCFSRKNRLGGVKG